MISFLINLILMQMMFFGVDTGVKNVRIKEREIKIKKWHKEHESLRFLIVGDLHLRSSYFHDGSAKKLIADINGTKPDVILLLGDYINYNVDRVRPDATLEELEYFVRQLKAKYGIYSVMGNHDDRFGMPEIQTMFHRAGIKVSDAKSRIMEINGKKFFLSGTFGSAIRFAKNKAFFRHLPLDIPQIVIGHYSSYFEVLPASTDLMFAGHTHGGQILLPVIGFLTLPPPYGEKYLYGEFRRGDRKLYVTSGVGYSGMPLRIGAPPEIVLFRIKAE